ncbi:unnamed protein product [Symbiodinium sp. CCMP2592]|nr:unnamed protein product [Symbiodinium sp. CCMP2592]
METIAMLRLLLILTLLLTAWTLPKPGPITRPGTKAAMDHCHQITGFRWNGPPRPRPVNGPDPADDQPACSEATHTEDTTTVQDERPRYTPARRPCTLEESSESESSTSSAEDDEPALDDAAAANDDAAPGEGWWSETSLIPEDEELESARTAFVNLYRRQLREEDETLNSRTMAARVGALRRRLNQLTWQQIQSLSTQRLQGAFLREWSDYEYRITHTYHPGRGQEAGDQQPKMCPFQELMAWLATNGTWDVVILQETHWGVTEDFCSGEWSCIHSSGHAAKDNPDKYAGILIMMSRKAFRNIAAQEHASLQLRPFRHMPKDQKAPPAFDRNALQAAIAADDPQAQLLQQTVSARVSALEVPASIHLTHQAINDILLQETSRLFPVRARVDHRVSANPGFRASATHTWALYRELKRPGVVTLANVWQRWRAWSNFNRASKELRQQSRQRKVAFHQDQLQQAEKARVASRLKDENGNIMTEKAELAAVLKYGQATFAQLPDSRPQLPLLEDLTLTLDEVWYELSHLHPRKAVPSHCAPSIVWKYCAQALHQPLGNALNQHFQVEQILQQNQSNRFTMRQGFTPSRCAGGACLSLDLSKAFDFVDRDCLTDSLLAQGIPPNIVAAIQQLHKQARYHYNIRSQTGSIVTTNGIKQGCRVAPVLWLCYSITVLQELARQKGDLELLLEVLTIFKLKVNYQKTALLLTLQGKDAEDILARHTITKEGKTYLKLTVLGAEQHLHIRDSHVYLGTIITYNHRLDLNISHRIESAQTKYQLIRRILNGKGPLSTRHKLRLWNACISPSLSYAIEAVGWTPSGVKRLLVLATRHIRAILKQPAHITHISNADIWSTAQLKQPTQVILEKLTNLINLRNPAHRATGADIVTNEAAHASLTALQAAMQSANDNATSQAAADESAEAVTCPHCQAQVMNQHALSIHISLHHQDADKPAAAEYRFDPVRHSIAGMPTCRLLLPSAQRQPPTEVCISHFLIGMTYADLEASIFAHCMPSGAAQASASVGNGTDPQQTTTRATQPSKRPRGPGWGPPQRPSRTPWQPPMSHQPVPQLPPPYPMADQQLDIISKLVLKHEEALHSIRKDTSYVMFFRQDEKSLVPNLMEVARQWREKATSATPDPALQSPLRTVLINCLLKELLQRTQRVVATEEGRANLKEMGWIDSQGHWTYLKWSPQQRRLVLNEARTPVTHDAMIKTITELQASMTGEIIHRFKSKQPMWSIEEEGSSQAVFDLEISLRSATADEAHMNFGVLMGNAVTNLVGMSTKKDDRPRQPQAQQLAQLVYPGRSQ